MKHLEFDHAIIGAGCIGSSIAYELTRRGFRNNVIVDSGRKTVSATASSGGMLRVFHENIEHVELALSHFSLLKKYQQRQIITEKQEPNGHLYFFNSRRYPQYAANFQKMDSAGYAFEIVTPMTGRSKFPQFEWADHEWAVYEPLGTHLSPTQFADDLLSYSQKSGMTVVDNFEVDRICHFRGRYKIVSQKSSIVAKTVILAGGARLLPHLNDLGIGNLLTSQKLTTYYVQKKDSNTILPSYFDRETLDFARLGPGESFILADTKSTRLKEKLWTGYVTEITANDCYSPNRLGFSGYLMGQPGMILATGWGGTAFKFSLEISQRIGRALESGPNERSLLHA
jgi:glycine/D-amino acid oxidase-like deaminating enzyme